MSKAEKKEDAPISPWGAINDGSPTACIFVVGAVKLWSEKVKKFISENLAGVQIHSCADPSELESHLQKTQIALIFFQAVVESDFKEFLQILRGARTRIQEGTVSLHLMTNLIGNGSLKSMEQQGAFQSLNPLIHPKALRIKVEYTLTRLKANFEKKRKESAADYFLSKSKEASPATIVNLSAERGASAPDQAFLATALPAQGTAVGHLPAESILAANARLAIGPTRANLSVVAALPEDTHGHLILISSREEDMALASSLALKSSANLHFFMSISHDIHNFIARYPRSVVLWDVDHPDAADRKKISSAENIGQMMSGVIRPSRVFALSSKPANRLPYLFAGEQPIFLHNLTRKNNPAAIEVYSKVLEGALSQAPLGIERFFKPQGSLKQEIQITHASHRSAAIAATETFLKKQGLSPRLATRVAQETDELLLNAIFNAPIDADGEHYRKGLDRSLDFAMTEREAVALSVMSNELYFGICVRDQFGSLDLAQLLSSLYRDHQSNRAWSEHKISQGIGLSKALETGFSLSITSVAGQATEAVLFFPRVGSHKEFKQAFRFLTALWHV